MQHMRLWAGAMAAGLLAGMVFGQARKSPPAFESVEIRPSQHLWNAIMQGGLFRDGRYEVRQATLMELIEAAYQVDPDTIFGGPPWLDWDRFDIRAQAPAATSQDAARQMLRSLLADRFQLAVHEDRKPLAAFVLARGKGQPKLREAGDAGRAGCQVQPPPPPQPDVVPYISASCRNVTMATFTGLLRGLSPEYVNNPVVDSTGLKGAWDFDFKWTPRGPLMGGRGGISLFDAIDRELGLKMEAEKIPMPVLVVDQVNRAPRESPGRAPAAVEFEVASIRLDRSDDPPPPPPARQFHPGGRVSWHGVPLRDLIKMAWDLDPDPHAAIPGAPKWLDGERVDLVAKAPASAMASATQIFSDDLQKMLRALLIDRFRMTTHYENRPAAVYTLVAVKPKLKPADASNRPGCRMAPPQPPADPTEGPPPHVAVCRTVTMAQFASRLQDLAKSYIRYPVVDGTGLEGAWDFTLLFHPAPPPDGGKKGGPPDQGARISIFSAVEKELGLKLEVEKRVMPVLVIDHIEPNPTDN
jgi:uncharacterized protein (TIGR03435 family)